VIPQEFNYSRPGTVQEAADLLVVVTGDHATPSSGPLIHSGEAIPILLAGGPNVLSDLVTTFHERAVISIDQFAGKK